MARSKSKVRNPDTGRMVTVGGTVWKKLQAKKNRRKGCGPGRVRSPKTGKCIPKRSKRGSRKGRKKSKKKSRKKKSRKSRKKRKFGPKFERCVKKVKKRLPKRCSRQKWKGKGCYNPWAICSRSVGQQN